MESLAKAKKFEGKKICVITGTSSGLGRRTAKALLKTGKWHVVGACRDVDKMMAVAEEGRKVLFLRKKIHFNFLGMHQMSLIWKISLACNATWHLLHQCENLLRISKSLEQKSPSIALFVTQLCINRR